MTSIVQEKIGEIVAATYEAAYDSRHWRTALEGIRQAMNGSRACIVRVGPHRGPNDAISTVSDPAFEQAFVTDERLQSDPLMHGLSRYRIGSIQHTKYLMGPDAAARSILWNEWMQPQDMHGGLICKVLSAGDSYWFFDVQHGRRQTFDATEAALMRLLVPQIRRATEIGRRLQIERSAAHRMKERTVGIVVVDSTMRISSFDARAEAILERSGCSLAIRNGFLQSNGQIQERLIPLVASACSPLDKGFPRPGGELLAIADNCVDGAVDLVLSIGPLLPSATRAIVEPSAVIFLQELSPALPRQFAQSVERIFGLTAKEAQLATLLAEGHSLKECAEAAQIRVKTASGYLSSIFAKTGARQQSELVAVIKTIAPLVSDA